MKLKELKVIFSTYFLQQKYQPAFPAPTYSGGILPPSSKKDLLLVNAGIVAVEPLIQSQKSGRFFSIQKCIRISGKHSDMEEIGSSDRHHTCFEMAGHFLWGNDFNPVIALKDCLDFLIHIGLEKEKLFLTFHPKHSIAQDLRKTDEFSSFAWKEDLTNEWQSGKFGNKGFCIEIYYQVLENESLEVWNCVYVNQKIISEDKSELLKEPYLDSGMGLSRLLSILNKNSDTYLNEDFSPLLTLFQDLPWIPSRRVADYLRTSTVMINEGIFPSAQAEGYVLRKLLRRSMTILKKYNFTLREETVRALERNVLDGWELEQKCGDSGFVKIVMEEFKRFDSNWDYWRKMVEEKSPLNERDLVLLYGEKGIPLELLEPKVRDRFDWKLCWEILKK